MPSKTGIQRILEECSGGPRTERQILQATGMSSDTFHRILNRFLGHRLRATRLRGRTYYEAHETNLLPRLRSEPELRCTACNATLDHRILGNLQQALRPCPMCPAWNWHIARTDGYINRPGGHHAPAPEAPHA